MPLRIIQTKVQLLSGGQPTVFTAENLLREARRQKSIGLGRIPAVCVLDPDGDLASVTEICRKLSIAEQTFYRWKRKFAGLGVAELRRLRQLEEENRKLKQLVADLTLDKHMLQEVLRKKF